MLRYGSLSPSQHDYMLPRSNSILSNFFLYFILLLTRLVLLLNFYLHNTSNNAWVSSCCCFNIFIYLIFASFAVYESCESLFHPNKIETKDEQKKTVSKFSKSKCKFVVVCTRKPSREKKQQPLIATRSEKFQFSCQFSESMLSSLRTALTKTFTNHQKNKLHTKYRE